MGQLSGFVSVAHLASGIDELLALLADETALASRRPPPPQGPNTGAVHGVVSRVLPGEVRFVLRLISRSPGEDGAGIWLLWHNEDPAAVRLPFNPELEWERYWSWRESNRRPTVFDLDVDLSSGSSQQMPFNLWSARAAGQKKTDPMLREVRSVAARYARPRLVLPVSGAEAYRDDGVALAALFASRAECLRVDSDLPVFFRSYCTSLFHDSFVKLYGRAGHRGSLPLPEWHSVIDRAFDRLYRQDAGRGFSMPGSPASFRGYVRQVLRGEAAAAWRTRRPSPSPSGVPASLEEAAERLGIRLCLMNHCRVSNRR
jgi:hypothetical protein